MIKMKYHRIIFNGAYHRIQVWRWYWPFWVCLRRKDTGQIIETELYSLAMAIIPRRPTKVEGKWIVKSDVIKY